MSSQTPGSSGGILPSSIELIRKRFNEPSFQQTLKGFTKTMQFSLTDLKEEYLFTFTDGKLTNLEKKNLPNANIIITTTNSVMESVMNKTSNPMTAYMTGKIKVKGAMDDLMRLQNLTA
jgi:putative sterol carrier protein